MVRALAPAALLALALPALAQEAAPGALIAGLSGDWNADGLPDLALLVVAPEGVPEVDLILYHGADRGLDAGLRVPGVAFGGPMFGQTPGLAARTATSFVVTSEQTAIGRTPWSQELTLAWRDGRWMVAGFTHRFYDRIDNRTGDCDVNLLTGAWEMDWTPGEGQPQRRASGRDGPRGLALADLPRDFLPGVCQAMLD